VGHRRLDSTMNSFLSDFRRRCARLPLPGNLTNAEAKARRSASRIVGEALCLAWYAAGWKLRVRNTSAMNLLLKRSSLVLRDPHWAIKDLKTSLFHCRQQSLTGRDVGVNTKGKAFPRSIRPTRLQLYQISCASRALPLPSKEVEEESLNTFYETVTNPHVCEKTDERVWNQFFSWCDAERITSRFARQYTEKKRSSLYWKVMGNSASLDHTRRVGGRTAGFAACSRFGPPPPVHTVVKAAQANPKYWPGRERRTAYGLKDPENPIVDARVTSVKERGYKCRIVTCNDEFRVARAHVVQRHLYRVATRNKTTVPAELPMDIPVVTGRTERMVYSADLSAATDTLCHRFLDRFCNHFGIEPELIHHGFTVTGRTLKRGAFMGMPASWSILELTNHYACHRADPSGSYRTKGDDVIGYWSRKQRATYRRTARAFGYKLNVPKSFESETMGTFCEGLYCLTEVGGAQVSKPALSSRAPGPQSTTRYTLRLQPNISLRGLCVLGFADKLEVMSTASHEAYRRNFPSKRMNGLLEMAFPKELQFAKKANLPLYMPRNFGGVGLVPDDPRRFLSMHEARIYWGILDKDVPAPPRLIVERPGPFTRKVLEHFAKIKWRSGVQEPCPHIEDIQARTLSWATCCDLSTKAGKAKQKPSSMMQIVSQLSKIKKIGERNASIRTQRVLWTTTLEGKWSPTQKSVQRLIPHDCGVSADEQEEG